MPNKIIYKALRRLLKAGEDTIPKLYIRLLLPDDPIIVDAGAHVGGDTQEMSRLWPRATVHAFEPVPDLFQKLTANTADRGSVRRYPLALGAETGTAEMFVSGGGSDASSSLLPPKEHLQINPHVSFEGRITVSTTTLDAWAQESGVGRIDFLWLDMQGAEMAAMTEGHRQRLDFVRRLQEHFGERIDVFGRSLRPFEDKWDVLAPYKYHVALENTEVADYWTEKLTDTLLAGAYPFYGGCPNIGDYFPDAVLTRLDITDASGAIRTIERGMAEERFEATLDARRAAATRLLDEYNLFPTLEKIIQDTRRNSPARPIAIRPQSAFTGMLLSKAKGAARRLLLKK